MATAPLTPPLPDPLPGADPPRGGSASLPQPLTALVGRADELGAARALLDRGDVRVLTLTGPGGVGKTRFAIALATMVADEFAHGVCFVPLAAIREPDLVGPAVAGALGVRESAGRSAVEVLPDVLRDQHLLLVLDNLEQVVGAAPWLASLLVACPRLTVLATSRVPLRISGEQRFPVGPLDVPGPAETIDVTRLPAYAALTLFVERAQAVDPAFRLTAANSTAVASICRRLDGLPLAIELAAARINAFDPATLAARLAHSLPLLTDGAREASPRLQSLRGAISWSYDLLTADEQIFLRWLSVFAGGFTLDVAEAMAATLGHDADWTIETIARLADQSLIRRHPEQAERFVLLETIREFGQERLALAGDEDAARDAHAGAMLAFIAAADRGQRSPDQILWLDRLEAEQSNIRAALAWLAARGEVERACLAAGSLSFFWMIRGYGLDGQRQLEALLAHPQLGERSVGRAAALHALSMVVDAFERNDRTRALKEEALSIFRTHDHRAGAALVLGTMYVMYEQTGALAESAARAEEAAALFREVGDAWSANRVHYVIGRIALRRGDRATAVRVLQECRAEARARGDAWTEARACFYLTDLAMDWPAAGQAIGDVTALAEESLRLTRAVGDVHNLPDALVTAGKLRRRQGELTAAARLFDEALTLSERTSDMMLQVRALGHRAAVARQQGDFEVAMAYVRRALAIAVDQLGSHADLPLLVQELACLAHDRQQPERAACLFGAADRLRQQREDALPEHDRAAQDAALQRVRAKLDAATFARAWATGQAMTDADVLAEAAALRASIPAKPATTLAAGLSARELEVLQRMAAGLSNHEIADELFISFRTVTSHVTAILGKLGVASRTAAVAYAIRTGLA